MKIYKYLKELEKIGRIFSLKDAYRIIHVEKNSFRYILRVLKEKGLIKSIEKGKYLLIPRHEDEREYTPNKFIIASAIVHPYAISYGSAFHHYGLTGQIPEVVYIQTTSWKRWLKFEKFGAKYQIVTLKEYKFFGIRKEWIEDTQVDITDKEKTIVDCLDKPLYCGGIVEVAKGLKNGKFDKDKLVDYAKNIGDSCAIRRLGYICEILGIDIRLPKIKTRNYFYLDPTMPKEGIKNKKWKVIVNLDEKMLEVL